MGRKSKKRKKAAPTPPRRKPVSRLAVAALVGAGAVFSWLVWSSLRPEPPSEPSSAPRFGSAAPSGRLEGGNLLLITIDTLRADHLGSYGSKAELTPHLDRLAREGIRFERVLAHVPVTLPAHASLLTSRYPTGHGVRDNGSFRLGSDVPTLATVLKRSGYQTGAFIAAFVLDARFGLNRGFDVYDDSSGEEEAFSSFVQLERRADAVVAPAEQWIRDRGRESWFAWVHLYDPHTPYEAPAEFGKRFPSDPYGAEVAYTDQVLGSFLDRLAAASKLENTLVTVVGDHGEALGEHGEKTHGTFAYNSTLRVPWILWADDGLTPMVFPERARHVDVMPTLLDLLGIAAPDDSAGQSLWPYLSGNTAYQEPVTYFEALNAYLTRDWAPLHGIVNDGYKLIRLPIPELYDLERDPEEKQNLYDHEPERARELEALLEPFLSGGDEPSPDPPDRETIERLRALGYVTAPASRRASDYTAEDDPKNLIDVSNAYDDASDLFARGRPEEALAILEQIVERQPRSSEAYRGVAYALYQMQRLDEAIEVLETGVENGLTDVSLLGQLGGYLLEAGQVEEAVRLLEDIVRRDPDYVEAHNYLGIVYGNLGRHDEARREFEKVLELDPTSAATFNNLATLALSRGDLEEARRQLGRALALDPGLASAHNRLAVVEARSGDFASAVASWKRAIELDPEQFDALYNLSMVLSKRDPQKALPYLERFVREAPREGYRDDVEKARALIRQIENAARR